MHELVEGVDEKYLVDVAQDVNEPVWETDANIAAMTSTDDPNDEDIPHLRTSSGDVSFLNVIEETVDDFLAHDKPVKPRKMKLDRIATREMGSDKWRGRKATIGVDPVKVVEESDQRRSIELYNQGPNIAYISSISSKADAPNTFAVPVSGATVYAPIRITSRDDVWAICAAGQSAVLSVLEVFDMES
jgi:hypothetical protein